MEAEMSGNISQILKELDREVPQPSVDLNVSRIARGIWAEGDEDDDFAQAADDDEWNNDDISSYAHGDLEQHREAREYARLAAWELPLLSSMSNFSSILSSWPESSI